MSPRERLEGGPSINWSIDEPPSLEEHRIDGDERAPTHFQALLGHRLAIEQGQQELIALEEIQDRIKLLEHQLSAAHQSINGMGTGTLFADEVGLGKTIEIGMVLKEMDLRDTHESFLVLTPAQLVRRWAGPTARGERFRLLR
ncbi:SNF2-related protein [Haladaptatus sp. ZSTT2]|uniref:SNF2-related protein n=1 Tax=Haladaptatus sp. ZSTT2 TaxID=3120515 RepID=UPI00300F6161